MKKAVSCLLLICLILSLSVGCSPKADDPADNPREPVIGPVDPDAEYETDDNFHFLMFKPTVTVRDGEYEIWVTLLEPGICRVVVGGEVFTAKDEIDDGRNFFRIRVPQSKLDAAKTYAICYLPEGSSGKAEGVEFEFKPIEKTEGINVYVISDVHEHFGGALREYEYWGDDVDLFVCNGDILDAIPTEDRIFRIISFFGDLSQGRYPLVTARGNHEYIEANREHNRTGTAGSSQGYRAYSDYISENGRMHYEFSIGPINGIVLDLFEGYDTMEVPGDDTAPFFARLEEETEFIGNTELDGDKINIVINHCCPVFGEELGFEKYSDWADLLNGLGIEFMICGHFHGNFILTPNDERSILPHDYPIVFGNVKIDPDAHSGMALTLYKDRVDVVYVGSDLNVTEPVSVQYAQSK